MFVDLSIDAGARLDVSEGSLSVEAIEAIEEVLRIIANAVEETIFSSWPVDTGRSLRAWRVYTDGLLLVIQNPVFYSSWVHPKGTRHNGDDLGISAEMVQIEAERGWQQNEGELLQIVEDDVARRTEPEGTLIGDAMLAFARRAALDVAGVAAIPGGELFTSLQSVFTLQSIAERERGRTRTRNRPRGR